jgi:hypothetical protein
VAGRAYQLANFEAVRLLLAPSEHRLHLDGLVPRVTRFERGFQPPPGGNIDLRQPTTVTPYQCGGSIDLLLQLHHQVVRDRRRLAFRLDDFLLGLLVELVKGQMRDELEILTGKRLRVAEFQEEVVNILKGLHLGALALIEDAVTHGERSVDPLVGSGKQIMPVLTQRVAVKSCKRVCTPPEPNSV